LLFRNQSKDIIMPMKEEKDDTVVKMEEDDVFDSMIQEET
jgi:hypothetical protein